MPGGSNTDVQFNNAGSFGGSNNFTWDGTSLILGQASALTGRLQLVGTTSGTVTFSVNNAAGTWTFKLPDTAGTSGQVLQTDGSGNTSWATASGGIGGSIADTQVAVGSGTDTIAGDAGFTYDAASKSLFIGASSGSSAASFWSGYPFVYIEEQTGDLTPGFVSYVYSTIANVSGGNFPMRSRGTPASPTAVLSGDKLGVAVEPAAYTGVGWGYSGTLYMEALENWSSSATGSRFVMKITPNGENQTASANYLFEPTLFTVPGGVQSNAIALTGNISSSAWTTNGIRIKGSASTFTDTSSSGTVAAVVVNALGGNTLAASSTTTYTDAYNTFINPPIAGTNVTLTNKWALGLGGSLSLTGAIRIGANTFLQGDTDTFQQYRSTNAQAYQLFNTRTDSSNGEWATFNWASNVFHIGVTKNGTGTARTMQLDYGGTTTAAISIPITSTNPVTIGGAGLLANAGGSIGVTGASKSQMTISGFDLPVAGLVTWSSTATGGASKDTGIARVSAGVIEINNATAGTYRDILARGLRSAAVTFASAIASPVEGTVQAFTDSTTATWGATITGGGSNHVLGYYNGTNWKVMG